MTSWHEVPVKDLAEGMYVIAATGCYGTDGLNVLRSAAKDER